MIKEIEKLVLFTAEIEESNKLRLRRREGAQNGVNDYHLDTSDNPPNRLFVDEKLAPRHHTKGDQHHTH